MKMATKLKTKSRAPNAKSLRNQKLTALTKRLGNKTVTYANAFQYTTKTKILNSMGNYNYPDFFLEDMKLLAS